MTSVKVKFDSQKVYKRDHQKCVKTKKILKNEIVKDTTPYVPYQEGNLKTSAVTNLRRYLDCIVWNGPYARFLYHGLVMVGIKSRSPWADKGEVKTTIKKVIKYGKKNPLAGYKWYERSKAKNKDKWLKLTKKVFKNG